MDELPTSVPVTKNVATVPLIHIMTQFFFPCNSLRTTTSYPRENEGKRQWACSCRCDDGWRDKNVSPWMREVRLCDDSNLHETFMFIMKRRLEFGSTRRLYQRPIDSLIYWHTDPQAHWLLTLKNPNPSLHLPSHKSPGVPGLVYVAVRQTRLTASFKGLSHLFVQACA